MTHIFVIKGLGTFISNLTEMFDNYNIFEVSNTEELQDDFKEVKTGDTIIIEWGNELADIITNNIINADDIQVIIRIHSYEAFDGYIDKINWDVVDKVIFVSRYVKNLVCNKYPDLKRKSYFIPNRININNFTLKSSFNRIKIAYVGHINFKKGGILLPQAINSLHKANENFEFHILGDIQNIRLKLYFDMFKEKHKDIKIVMYDWIEQSKVNSWLEDKDMILCTSLLESQNLSVMQAMLKGIKPLIHRFVGYDYIYPEKYTWETMDELINDALFGHYNPYEYRDFVKKYMFENTDYELFIKESIK
jgi:glycosyltransferase involved in cell wall biosynthesis